MEKVSCSGIGSLLLEIAEKASKVVGVRLGRGEDTGKGELDIFRHELDKDIMALFPNVTWKNFSIIQAIMVSEDGNQLLISGSENLPIDPICDKMIDEVVERLSSNGGMFCNTCPKDFRIRHWLVRRTGVDQFECHILPRRIKEVRFWDGGLIGYWSDIPDKLYFLPKVLFNDLLFGMEYWQFVYEIQDLNMISWRSADTNTIIASCRERIVWLRKSATGNELRVEDFIETPGFDFEVRGITGDGWLLLKVIHRCKALKFSFQLVIENDAERLYEYFCENEC